MLWNLLYILNQHNQSACSPQQYLSPGGPFNFPRQSFDVLQFSPPQISQILFPSTAVQELAGVVEVIVVVEESTDGS